MGLVSDVILQNILKGTSLPDILSNILNYANS